MVEETLVGPNVGLAQTLTTLLDEGGFRPRAVLWVHSSDTGAWKLWIVPPPSLEDKRQFYLHLARTFAEHQDELSGFDLGEVQFVPADHPAIRGLKSLVRVEGVSDVHLSNNMLNGYFLPDAVVIRMAA